MKKRTMNHRLSTLAPLLLFVSLTASVLLVLLQGADIYQTIAERNHTYYQKRTLAQYITTRIHQNDASGSIAIGDFHAADSHSLSGDTLYLLEEIDGRSLCTRIYCWDSYLCELFSDVSSQMKPSSGQKILAMENISFKLDQNLLTVLIEYIDGSTDTMALMLRSPQEAAYEK